MVILMAPPESAPQELSNEWSCQFVRMMLNIQSTAARLLSLLKDDYILEELYKYNSSKSCLTNGALIGCPFFFLISRLYTCA
jgi:hypothetical protein